VSAGTMLSPVKPTAGFAKAELSREVPSRGKSWFFAFFFLSGFCSILYELVWLRLTMAQFGVTTPMVSIVLSTFMAGLGIGSWGSGHLLRRHGHRLSMPHLQLYAITEMIIGCSALIAPMELAAGRWLLEHVGSSLSLSSGGYYVASGFWLALTLVPWCTCMGATIPLGMSAIRSDRGMESRRSFSFLYLANVLGAVVGALIPLLLIEMWGFKGTLRCGLLLNLAIGFTAFVIGRKSPQTNSGIDSADAAAAPNHEEAQLTVPPSALTLPGMAGNGTLWLLFVTGLTSLGMEVVWTRQFTIYLGTLVYSFATILGCYLAATFIGSSIYRWWSRTHRAESSVVWMFLWLAALIPLVTADPWIPLSTWVRLPLGITAFSGLLGFLTPRLVDQFSEGDPNRAGIGYAVNVAGCILGPLIAGFLLLPNLDERHSLIVLALPWLFVGCWFAFFGQHKSRKPFDAISAVAACVLLALSCCFIFLSRSYLSPVPAAQVRRDSTATVVAAGRNMRKLLFVNGINMTGLTPITKFMSALPLAHLDHTPHSALVICFGMGTTHRSMLSWGIDSTAVDLVPSVPQLFWYFHPDGPQVLASPHSHVVIDDGRRFLERTAGEYDVIAIDPPPPIDAAGSSLLYSREFYSAAQKRLRPDGILQQWFPGGDPTTAVAIARAIQQSFPYVRVFASIERRGFHYLASRQPIPHRTAAELAAHMPSRAADDLVEWGPYHTAQEQFAAVLKNEVPIDLVIARDENAPPITDDRPINEYDLLRSLREESK
jgi:spermidine synthase